MVAESLPLEHGSIPYSACWARMQVSLLLRELGALDPEEPVVLELKAELAFAGGGLLCGCACSVSCSLFCMLPAACPDNAAGPAHAAV